MPVSKKGFRLLALIAVAGGLWAGAGFAAEPTWDEVAGKLHAVQLPAGNAEAILAQAQARRLAPAEVLTWVESMARLQQAGAPVAPMGERIVQGLVKGVPPSRLGQALETLQANLIWAKRLIDRHAAKADIRANPAQLGEAYRDLEVALRAGLERGQVEQIFGKEPLTLKQMAALARVAANLRSWNVAPEAAVRALAQATRSGVTAPELDRLEAKFAAGMASGRSTEALLTELEQGIKEFRSRDRDEFQRDLRDQNIRQDIKGPTSQDMRPGPINNPAGPGGYPGFYK